LLDEVEHRVTGLLRVSRGGNVRIMLLGSGSRASTLLSGRQQLTQQRNEDKDR
jgi:hypothetical protein